MKGDGSADDTDWWDILGGYTATQIAGDDLPAAVCGIVLIGRGCLTIRPSDRVDDLQMPRFDLPGSPSVEHWFNSKFDQDYRSVMDDDLRLSLTLSKVREVKISHEDFHGKGRSVLSSAIRNADILLNRHKALKGYGIGD